MPAPDIDALPPVPLRTEAAGTFTPKAETFLDSLDTFRTQVNAFGDYLDGLGLDPAEIPDAVTDLTMATARLIGRTTAGTGAAEELTVGSGLSLATGSLDTAVKHVLLADQAAYDALTPDSNTVYYIPE